MVVNYKIIFVGLLLLFLFIPKKTQYSNKVVKLQTVHYDLGEHYSHEIYIFTDFVEMYRRELMYYEPHVYNDRLIIRFTTNRIDAFYPKMNNILDTLRTINPNLQFSYNELEKRARKRTFP